MTLQHDWQDIEKRCRERLLEAGITVAPVSVPTGRPHLMGYHYICFPIPVRHRQRAAKLLTAELGPDFVVRYYTHPQAHPQDAVYVFPADRAWPDTVFQESNVQRGRSYPRLR